MERTVIEQLNQLNRSFYSKVASSFSKTRQQQWSGWNAFITFIQPLFQQKERVSVLDIGCGNGRFLTFLIKSFSKRISYTGIDLDDELLHEAKVLLQNTKVDGRVVQKDFVTELLDKKFLAGLPPQKYDLIVSFGVFHHIPTQALRRELIDALAKITTDNGILIISFWQFAKAKRFFAKTIEPEKVNINTSELEVGDYLLSWDTETSAVRYCHSFSDAEIVDVCNPADWKVLATYQADGKENNLNTYLVLQRNKQ